jgi:hypothetical protein
MSHSWQALFFVSILLLPTFFVISQALAYDNPNSLSNLPVNSSAYVNRPNLPYYYSKENGADLEIKATVYNPINLFGNVTDPNGIVHQMSNTASEKGMVQLRFYASVYDPNGIYVARFQLIKGPATSDLIVTGGSSNYQKPVTHPALHIPMSPRQQITNGVLPENVVCADGLMLIKKISDDSPACVKLQTARKLVERGWGILVTSLIPNQAPTSCPTDQTMVNGQCVTNISTITPTQACKGDTLIPYSYALPCKRPDLTCPSGMTLTNGFCIAWGYTPPSPPPTPHCDPNTGVCSSVGYAVASCSGESSSGVICEPNSIPCPTGLRGESYGTTCNYSPPKCSTGYSVIHLSAGSYSCQPTNPPPLSNATTYLAGQKVGAFTISIINPYNVTGYYNNPYPIGRPGLGDFTIMHVGDALNPTCDGSAPLVITAINYPNLITVSIGKSMGIPYGGCPICLSANSVIKTPNGEVNVKDIKDGMTVWSTDSNGIMIKSTVIKINNVFVGDTHKVIDLQLADGRELFVSPNHPTYDGRIMADLKVGERYNGSTVKSIELVQYKYQFTYDILPDSQTGNYFANGILVKSTLK